MAQTLDQTLGGTVGQKTDQTPQAVVERPTREGSPWTGLWAVVAKDMADHLTSVRMLILMLLIVLTAVGTVWGALQEIRSAAPNDPFLFLRLFTTAHDPLPAFVGFLSFLLQHHVQIKAVISKQARRNWLDPILLLQHLRRELSAICA